tara:strand:+ start:510 stop:986 length:477 start_codon:yes stop_codon:yes gene_type:complete
MTKNDNSNQTKALLKKLENCANLLSDNSKFKKGVTAFQVSVWGIEEQTQKVTVRIRKIQIESFGKIQGTATCEENGDFIGVSLSPKLTILAHTVEDARKMAEQVGLNESRRSIAGGLRCYKSWMENYASLAKPPVVANVKAKLAFLETAKPSFDIIEN